MKDVPSNHAESSFTRISSDEMLEKLAKEMTQYVPASYAILLPIKCHQLGEMLHDFYVDQWPSPNICVAMLKPEYFYKFNTPPYQILHYYSPTNDPEILERMFNSLPIDWSKPIMLSPSSNERQVAIIGDIFRQHGGQTTTHQEVRKFFYTTNVTKFVPVPEEYEYVRLKPENAVEIFQNWPWANKPMRLTHTQFALEDIATLIERFPFEGIREKSTGKLVGYGGQLHCGTSGFNRVDPEHRGKKLFQAMLSRRMADCVERYGFAMAEIREHNAPSIAGFTSIGFQEQKGRMVYWLYMHPSALGPCPFSLDTR